MNEDFRDVLAALLEARARFIVVGAHALAVHGVPRATGDLDIWIAADPDNAQKVWSAMLAFGAPLEGLGISPEDFSTPGTVIQIGLPPRRIDILTQLTGVEFEVAWSARISSRVDVLDVPFIDRETFIANKRALGRHKDLADIESLGADE